MAIQPIKLDQPKLTDNYSIAVFNKNTQIIEDSINELIEQGGGGSGLTLSITTFVDD